MAEGKATPHVPIPHVLIFPFPGQGHISSMLSLAKILSSAGIQVTFLNLDRIHQRLLSSNPDLIAHHVSTWPNLRIRTISDGLPLDDLQSGGMMELLDSVRAVTGPNLRTMLQSDDPAVTIVVTDGLLTFVIDVADEVGIPTLVFRTGSACNFWACFCGPSLVDAGDLPFEDDSDMDKAIKSVPGMEDILRRRDLPSLLRIKPISDLRFQYIITETRNTCRAPGLIFNTCEELDGPILAQIRAHCPNIYAIGPLHAYLKRLTHSAASSISLWAEDRTCITWLDSQPQKSVLYISFGSFAVLPRSQLLEFWYGLVASQARFLWVLRPDLIDGGGDVGQMPAELLEATKERGCLVGWAPQEEVLAHSAVACFLTHSGWNSTLESVVAGVPMICLPFFADQPLNSRYVEEVWKIGLDMKDRCDRSTVEMMIREVMEGKREDLVRSTARMSDLAKKSVGQGGSSYMGMERLIEDIRSMSLQPTKRNH